MFDNVILVDYDGVCAYWEHSFDMWMRFNGYTSTPNGKYEIHEKYGIDFEKGEMLVKMFNESATIGKLPPLRGSIKYIKKLHEEHGYVFHCISAIPNDQNIFDLRKQNIENLFGKTAFERIVLTDTSDNKKEVLEFYKDSGCFWIEDVTKNAEFGIEYGLEPILVKHHYNENYTNPYGMKIVNNWKEIYDYIIGENI